MPKRQSHTKTVISTELQGADSWVIINMPTVQEARAMDDQLKAYTRLVELAEHKVKSLLNSEHEDYANALSELAIAQETLGDFSVNILANYVKDWNWVDDDTNPLPPPSTEGIVDKLYMSEFKWLMSQVIGSDEKKEPTKRR
jgi:hypothetical protein